MKYRIILAVVFFAVNIFFYYVGQKSGQERAESLCRMYIQNLGDIHLQTLKGLSEEMFGVSEQLESEACRLGVFVEVASEYTPDIQMLVFSLDYVRNNNLTGQDEIREAFTLIKDDLIESREWEGKPVKGRGVSPEWH